VVRDAQRNIPNSGIKDMNQLFDYRDAVRKAAQIIYADKPEISGMFD
jgi:hypothetical protein